MKTRNNKIEKKEQNRRERGTKIKRNITSF